MASGDDNLHGVLHGSAGVRVGRRARRSTAAPPPLGRPRLVADPRSPVSTRWSACRLRSLPQDARRTASEAPCLRDEHGGQGGHTPTLDHPGRLRHTDWLNVYPESAVHWLDVVAVSGPPCRPLVGRRLRRWVAQIVAATTVRRPAGPQRSGGLDEGRSGGQDVVDDDADRPSTTGRPPRLDGHRVLEVDGSLARAEPGLVGDPAPGPQRRPPRPPRPRPNPRRRGRRAPPGGRRPALRTRRPDDGTGTTSSGPSGARRRSTARGQPATAASSERASRPPEHRRAVPPAVVLVGRDDGGQRPGIPAGAVHRRQAGGQGSRAHRAGPEGQRQPAEVDQAAGAHGRPGGRTPRSDRQREVGEGPHAPTGPTGVGGRHTPHVGARCVRVDCAAQACGHD